MKNLRSLFLLLIVLSFAACQNEDMSDGLPESYQFLHLSHTRLDDNASVDEAVGGIDYDQYDVLMLGGDLEVHNLNGTLLISESHSNTQFHCVSDLINGLYIVTLKDSKDKIVGVEKLIISN